MPDTVGRAGRRRPCGQASTVPGRGRPGGTVGVPAADDRPGGSTAHCRRLSARRSPCRTRSAAQGRWPSGPRSPNPAPPAAPGAVGRPGGSTAPATACRPGVPHAGRDRPRRAVGPRAHALRTRRRLPRPALLAVPADVPRTGRRWPGGRCLPAAVFPPGAAVTGRGRYGLVGRRPSCPVPAACRPPLFRDRRSIAVQAGVDRARRCRPCGRCLQCGPPASAAWRCLRNRRSPRRAGSAARDGRSACRPLPAVRGWWPCRHRSVCPALPDAAAAPPRRRCRPVPGRGPFRRPALSAVRGCVPGAVGRAAARPRPCGSRWGAARVGPWVGWWPGGPGVRRWWWVRGWGRWAGGRPCGRRGAAAARRAGRR
ncbi:UNVERIFIED_CONTAM: hypothetical protein RKD43_007128 [Streptomyces graminofaciens]